MSNKILDHIECVTLHGEARAKPLRLTQYTLNSEIDRLAPDPRQIKIAARLRVEFVQHIEANAPPQAHEMVKMNAKKAIARQLYGDVVNSLHEIQEAMWEEGDTNSPALRKVGALIDELSGRMKGFE